MGNISRGRSETQVALEVARLATLSVKELKARWRSLYTTEPPRYISRELLTRRWGTVCKSARSAASNPPRSDCSNDSVGIAQRIIRFTLLRGRPPTVPCWFGSGAESVIASKSSHCLVGPLLSASIFSASILTHLQIIMDARQGVSDWRGLH